MYRDAYREALSLAVLLSATASPAAAYTCAVTPAKDAVVVKTSNPDAQAKSCTVTCNFAVPGGVERITCTQTVPGGAKDWFLCIRPTGGKAFGALESGQDSCAK